MYQRGHKQEIQHLLLGVEESKCHGLLISRTVAFFNHKFLFVSSLNSSLVSPALSDRDTSCNWIGFKGLVL